MSRYICAEELIDELYEHEFSNWCDKDEVSELIDNMPTADVEPVRLAYAIVDEDGNLECSNCGSSNCYDNYCPNCGARITEWIKEKENE